MIRGPGRLRKSPRSRPRRGPISSFMSAITNTARIRARPAITAAPAVPSGYGIEPWNADFFAPSAPLFAAAPWIMVRGNHEDCSRAGEGWFRFLDPSPMEATCRDLTGDYVVRLGDFSVLVVDSAKVKDTAAPDSDQVPILRRQLARRARQDSELCVARDA